MDYPVRVILLLPKGAVSAPGIQLHLRLREQGVGKGLRPERGRRVPRRFIHGHLGAERGPAREHRLRPCPRPSSAATAENDALLQHTAPPTIAANGDSRRASQDLRPIKLFVPISGSHSRCWFTSVLCEKPISQALGDDPSLLHHARAPRRLSPPAGCGPPAPSSRSRR